jgi:N-acetylneuraminic acid mutarotase
VGGHPGPQTDACFVYDHSEMPGKQWKSLPSLPQGRSGGSLVHLKAQNALFFTGGAQRPKSSEYKDYPDSWMYPLDGNSTVWIPQPNLPFLSNHMSYVSAVDDQGMNRYFFLAGQMAENEANGNVDLNYEYNPATNVWIKRQNMIFPRGHTSSSTVAVSCGFILVGGTTNGGVKTREIHYYDIPSDRWTNIGNFSQGVNTPVCDIDRINNVLYCETGWATGRFSSRTSIAV